MLATLKDAETRYTRLEKLVYGLVTASRKLRQYFQGRQIMVMTDQSLRRILHKHEMTGHLASWTIELSEFNIEFFPRTTMSSQELSDFISDCNFHELEQGEIDSSPHRKIWTLFTDGSSMAQSGGGGVI